jgi:V8-like Glu-specific endopeptidase
MSRPHLKLSELRGLASAFDRAGLEYEKTRASLLDGVNPDYVERRLNRVFGKDGVLRSDLKRLNLTGRLKDGKIPFEQWLENAVELFSALPGELQKFEKAHAILKISGESTEIVLDFESVPRLETEELSKVEVGDFQNVSFLSVGAKRAAAVAKISVPMFIDGKQMFKPDGETPIYGTGTGWLISKNLIVTNHHVIANREVATQGNASATDLRLQAGSSNALFFYDRDGEEGRRIKIVELIAVGNGDNEDFAVLRLAETPNISWLPILNEKVRMSEPVTTVKGTSATKAVGVNIIQHPWGSYKRIAIRNNLVYRAEYPTLHYFTDTLGGSSGSPVFDDYWRVVALHRAAVVENEAEFHGKNYGYVNQGIQIHAVMERLEQLAQTETTVAAALSEIKSDQEDRSVFSAIQN